MVLRDRLKKLYAKVLVLISRVRLRLKPNHDWSRLQLAHAHVQQKSWQSAIDLSLQVLTREPKNASAYHILASAYAGQGESSRAFAAIATAIQLDPNIAWFYQDLGKLYLAEESYDKAIVQFRKAVDLDEKNSWLQFNLGEALVKQGNWKGAIEPLRRTIQLNPVFAWSYFYLAEAHLNLGDLETAIGHYRKAILVGPDIAYLHESLAYANHLKDQDDRIQAFCQQAQQQDAEPDVVRKPRVLLITPYAPYPPKLGGHSRMFYEMKALHAKTDLVVMSLGFSKLDFPLETDLARFSQLAVVVAPGDHPVAAAGLPKALHRYSSQRMEQLLTVLNTANFDCVVMDFIYMAQYRHLFPNSFTVLSEHNVESQLLRRQAEVLRSQLASQEALEPDAPILQTKVEIESARSQLATLELEAAKLEAYEDQLWPQFSMRTVVSELDRSIIDRRAPGGKTLVVSNGINTKTIQPFEDNPIPRVLFMGTLNYFPNIDGVTYLIQKIMPEVWHHNPTIGCWIAGAGASQQIYDLTQDPRIKIISDPEHMEDVAKECCCTIVSLRIGGGTRIKILHSMAMGLPVISTSLGCEGLNLVDGEDLLIRDQPEDLAEAIVEIIKNPELRQRLRAQGRELVEQQYDWESIFDRSIDDVLTTWRSQRVHHEV
jgi:tetratricopeptide (TPR) repeat protein